MSLFLPLATYNAGVRQVRSNVDFLDFLKKEFLAYAPTDYVVDSICSASLVAEEYLTYLVDDMATNRVTEQGVALSKEQGMMLNLFQDNLNDAIAGLYFLGISFTEQ
jgi:hypothetical protein